LIVAYTELGYDKITLHFADGTTKPLVVDAAARVAVWEGPPSPALTSVTSDGPDGPTTCRIEDGLPFGGQC